MEFIGINAPFIKQYVEFKRSLGYAFKHTNNLSMFDRFTVAHSAKAYSLGAMSDSETVEHAEIIRMLEGIAEASFEFNILFDERCIYSNELHNSGHLSVIR